MIEFTIKTLDSNNHTITVDDDTTVYGLKQKVLEKLGIEIDQQRLIFFGRVLHDNKKLSEYGVDGKVVHLVERPPPRSSRQPHAAPEEPPSEMARRTYEMPFSITNENEHPTSPIAARIEFLQRSIDDIKGLMEALRGPDIWFPQPESQRTTPEFERLDGSGIYDPSAPHLFTRQVRRRAKRSKSAHTRHPSSSQAKSKAYSPQPGPSRAGLAQPGPSQARPSHVDISQPGPSNAMSQSGASTAGPSTSGPSSAGPSAQAVLSIRTEPISPNDSPTNGASSDSGLQIGASAAAMFTDRLGRVFEPKPNVPRTQQYADLLTELMDLEEQFNEYRRLYVEWIRSTPGQGSAAPAPSDEETVRRKQQFSNLMSELHHCFAHAYHVISDLNFQVTPTVNRIVSEGVVASPIQVQVLTTEGQHTFITPQPPAPASQQQEQAQMPPPPPPQPRNEREQMPPPPPPPPVSQMPPPQPQPQPQPQQPRQFHPSAEIIMQQVAPGVQAPVMLGTPATALNINMQPNPVTFQLEIETRSLEAALLNTVSQFVASQVAGAAASAANAAASAANAASANNPANNQATPPGNQPRPQITPPILGLNLGTTVHLGTFNLGTFHAPANMDVDHSAAQGTNMETDGQAQHPNPAANTATNTATNTTTNTANNAANANQDGQNQSQSAQANRQMWFDFENLFRGLTQAHGLGEMEIVMSVDGSGQEESAAGGANNPQASPGILNFLPGAQQAANNHLEDMQSIFRYLVDVGFDGLNDVNLDDLVPECNTVDELALSSPRLAAAASISMAAAITADQARERAEEIQAYNATLSCGGHSELPSADGAAQQLTARLIASQVDVAQLLSAKPSGAAAHAMAAVSPAASARVVGAPAQVLCTRDAATQTVDVRDAATQTSPMPTKVDRIVNFKEPAVRVPAVEDVASRMSAARVSLHTSEVQASVAPAAVRNAIKRFAPVRVEERNHFEGIVPIRNPVQVAMEQAFAIQNAATQAAAARAATAENASSRAAAAEAAVSDAIAAVAAAATADAAKDEVVKSGSIKFIAAEAALAEAASAVAAAAEAAAAVTVATEMAAATTMMAEAASALAEAAQVAEAVQLAAGAAAAAAEASRAGLPPAALINTPPYASVPPGHPEGQRQQRRAGVRTRMRAPAMPLSHGIYDRFLVCNSPLARRQLIRRRQAAEAARQAQEERALQERAKREDRESRDAPQNQSGVHALMRVLANPYNFAEAMVVSLIVSVHEATTPEVYMILSEEEFEALRRVMQTGVRHMGFICMNRGFPVTPQGLAVLVVRLFQEFIENLSLISSIRPNVNEFASVRAVFNMYMQALCAVLQREPTAAFIAAYRQLLASFFFDLSCLLVHICRDGFRGFRPIFEQFIEELIQLVQLEQHRDLLRMLGTSLMSRVADHIETSPSNPHQFVVRTDGLLPCICFDEAERSSRAVSNQSDLISPRRLDRDIEYPLDYVNNLMHSMHRGSFDETAICAIFLAVCESLTFELSALWDEDLAVIKRILMHYTGQFTSACMRFNGQTSDVTNGIIDHLGYFTQRVRTNPRLRQNIDARASIYATMYHYMEDILDLLVPDGDEVFVKNFKGMVSELYCTLLSVVAYLTPDGIHGLKMMYRQFINEMMALLDTEELRELLQPIANYNLLRGISTIQLRPVEFHQFLVPAHRELDSSPPDPQASTSAEAEAEADVEAEAQVPREEERSSVAPKRTIADAIEQSAFAAAEQSYTSAPRSSSATMDRSPFVVPERAASAPVDRPPAISVKRLSSLTGQPPTSTLTVDTPSLLSPEEIAAVAARLQAVADQTSVTVTRNPPDLLLQPTPLDERHRSRAEKRSSSRASSSDASSSRSSSKSKSKHHGYHHSRAQSSDPTPSTSDFPPGPDDTPMAGLERFQKFRSPYFPYGRSSQSQPQACYGCLNPSVTEEQPYDPTSPTPLFFFNPALNQQRRGYRSVPTATVTSGCLNAQGSSSASPNLVIDSPERSPPRMSTSSPVNKRMKQESETDQAGDAQGAGSSGSRKERKGDGKSKKESKRKHPSRGHDRDPNQDGSAGGGSSESHRQSRDDKSVESEWGPIIENDLRIVPEPQPPFSDAYLSGMSARRRRRVRQARPPLEAGAFMHECLSAASERAIEGGDVERSVFRAFYESFGGLTAARVNGSEDYRPSLHSAVHKLLNGGSSQEGRPGPEQANNIAATNNN